MEKMPIAENWRTLAPRVRRRDCQYQGLPESRAFPRDMRGVSFGRMSVRLAHAKMHGVGPLDWHQAQHSNKADSHLFDSESVTTTGAVALC